MMKKKSSILGRSESVRAPVSYYGERDPYTHHQQLQQQGRLHHGPASVIDQVDYMSEDGLVRHGGSPGQANGNGGTNTNGGGANKRVSFNRDVAVKRIPSILHHNRPSSANATATAPAAVVVVFPSNNSATVSQINGGGGRRGANLASLAPDQQQMLLREARNVLEQMESISCQVSRDSQPPPQHWRYSSSPSPPPSPVLVPRRRAVHPPPVSRPLKRSESLAGIFYSSKRNEPSFARDQKSPSRVLNRAVSNSNSNLNLNSQQPPAPRVVKKRSPSIRTPLFPQKSNNSLGESSGSGSSGEASGPTTTKPRSGSEILPPSLWTDSFSYTSASGHSTSTPSPISSLSSASSAGSATKQYFFGQDPALHSDLNENVIFRQPQSLKIFQNHHNRGLGIGTPTTKPTGFMSEDELASNETNRTWVRMSTPKATGAVPTAATTLAALGTLERKKQASVNVTKKAEVPDQRRHRLCPPKEGPIMTAMKKASNVTTVVVNSNTSSSSSSECGVSLAGEDADDDEEEDVQTYPLILRATSALDTHPPPIPIQKPAHKPFFYGDRLPTEPNAVADQPRPILVNDNQTPATSITDKSTKPTKESTSGHGFMSTLLRRKSAKMSVKPERKENISSPIVLQLGTEQRLQQKQRLEQSAAPVATKRPTRVKSFLALFMGRGVTAGEDTKKKLSKTKGNSISTPSLEKWSRAADADEYTANYKSNNHYY